MVKYMKSHEKFIMEKIDSSEDYDWEKLAQYHKVQFEIIQHERLVHLLVTLFFGLFFLLTVLFAAVFDRVDILPLGLLFLVLLVPYIIHYYKLENGVQRWYTIYIRIQDEIAKSEKK